MLKYLFKVEYTDGTTFKQNKEDVSSVDNAKSAFYDVLQSEKEIKTFTLTRFLERYSVNLETGEFSINGTNLVVEDGKTIPLIENHSKLKLIFYRQHKQPMNIGYKIDTGKITSIDAGKDQITYFIGWEITIKGKSYKRIIGIK